MAYGQPNKCPKSTAAEPTYFKAIIGTTDHNNQAC